MAFQSRSFRYKFLCSIAGGHPTATTIMLCSSVYTGVSREPLPIIAWWTRRHTLYQDRTRDLVREKTNCVNELCELIYKMDKSTVNPRNPGHLSRCPVRSGRFFTYPIPVRDGAPVSKFKNLVGYSQYFVPILLMIALLISSLVHTCRTIKMLRKADDSPAETREQRRNGAKMVLILAVGQVVQLILGILDNFMASNTYVEVTQYCLFQCFQASYTAVVLLVADKDIQSEVWKMLASLKIWENTNDGQGDKSNVGVLISLSMALQPRSFRYKFLCSIAGRHPTATTIMLCSSVYTGVSREPLPIIAWWTRRHALYQDRTRDLVQTNCVNELCELIYKMDKSTVNPRNPGHLSRCPVRSGHFFTYPIPVRSGPVVFSRIRSRSGSGPVENSPSGRLLPDCERDIERDTARETSEITEDSRLRKGRACLTSSV
eukprot:sb/3464889/